MQGVCGFRAWCGEGAILNLALCNMYAVQEKFSTESMSIMYDWGEIEGTCPSKLSMHDDSSQGKLGQPLLPCSPLTERRFGGVSQPYRCK